MKEKLLVKKNRSRYAIPFEEIVSMSKDLRKVFMVTRRGELEFYDSFSRIRSLLDNRFMMCHRSFIINMDEIVIISDGKIVLSDGEILIFGKKCYAKALKTFEEYYKRNN